MTTSRRIDGATLRIGYFTTADGTAIRSGHWCPEGRQPSGSVVLLGGRKEFLEKYTETAADLNQRGFEVFGFDWRGQGLSSRMLPDRLKGFVRNYNDYVQDLEDFFQRVVQPEAARPIYVIAHSMGGHVALRYLQQQPASIDKAILVAPMLDINTKPYPRWLVRGLAWLGRLIGGEDALVPGSDKRTNFDRPFEGNALTADPRHFRLDRAHPPTGFSRRGSDPGVDGCGRGRPGRVGCGPEVCLPEIAELPPFDHCRCASRNPDGDRCHSVAILGGL